MKKRLVRRIFGLTLCLSLFTFLSLSAYAAETVQTADNGIGPGYETVYDKESASAASDNRNTETPEEKKTALPGESLGIFRISAYCNCDTCSGGHKYTYSGEVPQADHTISADLERFPLGTKLYIGGIVYTVEDMGGGITDNRLDIYFSTHEEALAYGLQDVEVFTVAETDH